MKTRFARGLLFVSLAGAVALSGCQTPKTADVMGISCCCTEKGMECTGSCGCACESCVTPVVCCCTEKGKECTGNCGCACESCKV